MIVIFRTINNFLNAFRPFLWYVLVVEVEFINVEKCRSIKKIALVMMANSSLLTAGLVYNDLDKSQSTA